MSSSLSRTGIAALLLAFVAAAASAADVTIETGADQDFTATVLDQFGNPMATQPTVTWSATGGSLSASTGPSTTYTAGSTLGLYQIEAVSGALNDSKNIEIIGGPPPVALLAMDDGSGSTAADTSGVGEDHSATLQGGAQFISGGVSNGAVRLDGSGDYLTMDASSDLNLPSVTTERTISIWFRMGDAGIATRQMLFEEGGGVRGLNIYLQDGLLYGGGWNLPTEESDWSGTYLTTPVADTQWHHVALVLEAGPSVSNDALRLYLDGAPVASGPGSQLWAHSDANGIGAVNNTTYAHDADLGSSGSWAFQGDIDELAIYLDALGDNAIADLAGIAPPPPTDDPPVVDAGIDAGATLSGGSAQVALDGTVTDDGPFTVQWSATGPAAVGFGNDTAIDTTATFTVAGSYTLTLTADDGVNAPVDSSITVTIAAEPAVAPVALLTMDDGSGSTASDTSGNGDDHSATLQGGAQFVSTGIQNGAVQLDGSGDYLTMAASNDLNLPAATTARTISLWFKMGDAGVIARQMLYEEGGSLRGFNIYLQDGLLYGGGWNLPSEESDWSGTYLTTPVADVEWHHVALVLEAGPSVTNGALRLYLDGTPVASGAGSQLWAHGDPNGIGGVNNTTYTHDGAQGSSGSWEFQGDLDELAIYVDALDDAAIADLAGLTPPPPTDDPPVVDAGSDTGAILSGGSAQVALDGTVTDDGPFTVQWSASGPATVAFADDTAVDTTATFTQAGSYTLTLTADDGVNSPMAASITVIIDPPSLSATPVALFAMEDGSGSTTAADTSAKGIDHTATVGGDAQFGANGMVGNALQLDGTGDHLAIEASDDLNSPAATKQRTIALWFQMADAADGSRQILYEEGGTVRGFNIYLENGLLYGAGWNLPTNESGWAGTFLTTAVADTQWHHVALVLDGGSNVSADALQLYLDGVPVASGEGSQLWPHGDPNGIGAVHEGSFAHDGEIAPDVTGNHAFNGLIDEVRIYTDALNDTDIDILANQTQPLNNG